MSDNLLSWSSGDNVALGGMFWDMTKDSPIDDLLDKRRAGEDVTLEQFLDEQTILQEVIAPNAELLEVLVEHLDEMIDYLTLGRKRNADDGSEQHMHANEHYAYLSCEILGVNAPALTNAVLKNERYLERLFQILYEPAPLPARPSGYFHMILLMLAQKDPAAILTFASREPSPVALTSQVSQPVATQHGDLKEPQDALSSSAPLKDQIDRGSKRPLEEEDGNGRSEMVAKKPPGAPVAVAEVPTSEVELSLGAEASKDDAPRKEDLDVSQPESNQNLGLLPYFLRHIDSYSMACSVLVLVQAAANQLESQASNESSAISKLIYSAQELSLSKAESADLARARKLWTGGFGAAHAIFAALKNSTDPYSHSNAAELLIELYKRAASARRVYFETKQLAAMHVTDDEQNAPFAMSEDELGSESVSTMARHAGSPLGGYDDAWTLPLIDELCDMILSAPTFTSATDAAARVLSMLVVAYSQPFSGVDSSHAKQESCPEVERLLRRLPELVRRLIPNDGEKDFIKTQWGGHIARLGMGRLLIVEIISNLIVCGYKAVAQELSYMEPDPVAALVDVFFKFEWNNVLHSLVEKTLKAILLGQTNTVRLFASLPSKDSEEQAANNQKAETERLETVDALLVLQKSIFPRLIERILEAYHNDSNGAVVEERYVGAVTPDGAFPATFTAPKTKNVLRPKGYMGHLRTIANACAEVVEAQNEKGGPAFDALGEDSDLKQRWYDFANGKLVEINQMLSKPLGGAPIKREPIINNASALLAAFGNNSETLLKSIMKDANLFGYQDPDFEDDDDDDDDDDPEATMERYNRRKQEMEAEKLAQQKEAASRAQHVVASSPQDTSWVVDDFDNDSSGNDVFDSPSSSFDAVFDPLAGNEEPKKPVVVESADDAEDDDFDPFGAGKQVQTSATSASMPIVQKEKPVPTSGQDDFGGVSPGFEVIDKMM